MLLKKQHNKIKILSKKPKLPRFLKGLIKSSGRNNAGRITSLHRGGRHKRSYRQIAFNRNEVAGTVTSVEYDPNRTAFIAAVEAPNTPGCYILATTNTKIGDIITSNVKTLSPIDGSHSLLIDIPLGKPINSINIRSNQRAKLVRSAGTFATLVKKDSTGEFKVKLPSGVIRTIPSGCSAVLGAVSNATHNQKILRKAGVKRWLGIRPSVRGVAKNPVDHPHGGGEGKTSGGRPSVSFTGKLTKGKPTSKAKIKKKR